MKVSSVIFDAPKKASFITVDEDIILNPDEVLIESDYTVISAGTELANFLAMPNTCGAFPRIPGYCGAGRIIAVGSDVVNLKVGDRAVINWGGHKSHLVKKSSDVTKIDDDSIDSLEAAFAAIVAMSFQGVRKLKIEPGESVMVAGQGLLGVFATQIARLSGAVPLIVSDLDPKRRDLALSLGADLALSPDDNHFIEKIMEITDGKGVNAVVEVTGVGIALKQALEYIAWQGRISLLGCTRIPDVNIDFYQYVHRRGITLIGAHTFTRPKMESYPNYWTEHDDYRAYLKLLAGGRMKARPIVSEIISPAEAAEIYPRLAEMKNPPLGIVYDWNKIRQPLIIDDFS